jgi:hypothetical protein
MDSASIVYTALGILFIMQCITLAAVISIKRTEEKGQEKRDTAGPAPFPRDRERDQRDRERERRGPRPDNRPQQHGQPVPQPSTSSVDKSLREINLRLRNAERDQERARRHIDQSGNLGNSQQRQENRFRDKQLFNRRRDSRDNREQRGNRDQRNNRDNWQRNRDREQPRQHEARPEPRSQAPQPASPPQDAPAPPVAQQNPSPAPAPKVEAVAPVVQENLEHGRKITVRRRVLPNGGNGIEGQTNVTGTPPTADGAQHAIQTQQAGQLTPEQPPDPAGQANTEVSFGRR